MLTSLIGVIILLGGLIFFHELGHYSIAKLFGVKVEVFSLGFGKKIFRRKWGETEYALSLFPLGGYVKLMGDDPYKGVPAHEAERAFCTQKLYKRFLIVAAGPLANLLLAYVLYTLIFFVGQPMIGNQIGNVVVNSPAWDAGLRNKDRIVGISGAPIRFWTEMEENLKAKVGERVELQIERSGNALVIPYVVSQVRMKNPFGEEENVGGIKGVSEFPLLAMVGISKPDSLAGVAGLKTGDRVTKVNGTTVLTFIDLKEAIDSALAQGTNLDLTIMRGETESAADAKESTATLSVKSKPKDVVGFGVLEALGIYPSDIFVHKISPDSPAQKGGLMPGDRISMVNGKAIHNFEMISDLVQLTGKAEGEADIQVERNGLTVTLSLKPESTTLEDPLTHQSYQKFLIGFKPYATIAPSEYSELQIRNPIQLVSKSFNEVNTMAYRMLLSLGKLVNGSISVKNLGGPVMIASVAGKSLDAGLIPFIQVMALISINLFLLNLFPIPILDGGHLLFFAVEGARGRPVSIRTMEIANQVGMVFILMLVGLTFFNDISRIIFH